MPLELRRAKPPDTDFLLEELGFHRLELEIYAFNERACAHAERSGFVREGRKRRAYLKDGEWVDSILYALLADELGSQGG